VENAQIRGNLLPFDNFHLATTPDKRAAIAPPSTLRKLRISSDTFQVGSRRRADSMDSFLCGRRFERQYASQAHVRALEPHPPPPLSMQFTTAEPQLLVISRVQRARRPHPHRMVARQDPRLAAGPGADRGQQKMPDAVFDWMILLHYDSVGHLQSQKLFQEPSPLP
jgi:hypothetical protein